jgi:two-component system chemotaxis response regulator CheB
MSTRVLIVDDSATMRAILKTMLGKEGDIHVVGTAANAAEARERIKELNPDVITLDIEMPGMNGLEFLAKIMALRPTPVIIVSGHTGRGAEVTMEALQIGAFDCYEKPSGHDGNLLAGDGGVLAHSIRLAARHGARQTSKTVQRAQLGATAASPGTGQENAKRLIAIGASTGGVEALTKLLAQWPANCPPTLIVQHISGALAKALARRLNTISPANVALAESDCFLKPGHVYIAPGNERHLVVRGRSRLISQLTVADPVSGHRPSVDVLFESVASVVQSAATGILLTGMGEDGARGLLAMRKAGAETIAQDEATSIVYGMPRAASELGAANRILPINRVAEAVFA